MLKTPDHKFTIEKPKSIILEESKYYKECIDYAIGSGWVQKNEKDVLRDQYLKPIFQKYLEVIHEVETEIKSDADPGTTMEKIIEKLNIIMERTKRIGSTEPSNITRSIGDFYRFSCTQDTFTEYAAMALYQFIAEIINK